MSLLKRIELFFHTEVANASGSDSRVSKFSVIYNTSAPRYLPLY